MKTLCIYHAHCQDGFAAAWAVQRQLGLDNVDFHAASYGEDPPDVAGRDVLIVDFCYKRPVLVTMGHEARSIVILDHHKTAKEDLIGLPLPRELSPEPRITAWFDMERSGAGLTWDYITNGAPRPKIVDHIEDRDLWRFKIPGTREVCAAIGSYPMDFECWNHLAENIIYHQLVSEGAAILRKHDIDVAAVIAATQRRMVIGGASVPVANAPYTMASDIGNALARGEMFAACYWDTPTGRTFSLRSAAPDGADVAKIAETYNGGGHKHAAGFRMPIGWEGDAQ